VRPEKLIMKALHASRRGLTPAELAESVGENQLSLERAASILKQLERSGSIAAMPNGRYVALRERNLTVGRLSMNRKGFGFVGTPVGDVYVRRNDTAGAMHGDTVAVRLDGKRSREGRSGEIVQVLEHGVSQVVGRFERHAGLGVVAPTDPRIRGDLFIEMARETLRPRPNDIVVARITRYATKRDQMQGELIEVLGAESEPGVDVEIIIRERGLAVEFPGEVLAEAGSLSQDVDAELGRGREDLRELLTLTIDPEDARDFDDAISCVREGGGFRLWVHIADVSHYVPWDSAVDVEARHRATSVYLVDRVLPMLPEHLSNGICSLNPAEDRLTFTAEMLLDKTGLVEEYRLYPSVIRSDHRLSYGQVQGWLDEGGYPDDETRRLIEEFRSVTSAVHDRRIARGGLDFETVEPRVKLADDGTPIEVVLRKRTVATNMIEEAMILANEVVARHMTSVAAPMLYRIHVDPDPDALQQVAVILKEFDYPIKDVTGATPRTFQKIIAFAETRPEKLLINSLLLRALERARYEEYLAPHFGLASEAYCHFTSPIRRYPDLIVHRLLRAQLAGALDRPPTSSMVPELGWLAEHSSVMEREAEAAENDSVKVKLVQLMGAHLGEEFDGIITSAMSFGVFVQLENTAEGLVHVQTMTDDYYRLDAERFMLWGENRGLTYRLGQKVRVRVIDVSVSERRIDFELA
jgi:ribonuclease R